MRTVARLALLLVLLAAAPAAAATTTPIRIMALGDSLTIGYGDPAGQGYRRELSRLLPAAVWTAGTGYHNGWTVQDIRAGIDAWMAADSPDVVLLLVGTNNAAGVAPGMAGFETAYLDLVARILALSPTVHVYAAEVPYSVAPWAAAEVDVNVAAIHASWSSSGRVHLADLSGIPRQLLLDGIHPGADGYDIMGRQWYRAMAARCGLPAIPPDAIRNPVPRPGYEIGATAW